MEAIREVLEVIALVYLLRVSRRKPKPEATVEVSPEAPPHPRSKVVRVRPRALGVLLALALWPCEAAAQVSTQPRVPGNCTDAQVLGGQADGSGVECQADQVDGGAASTAGSLAANAANCAAGSWAAGVDAAGAAEGCTADNVDGGAAATATAFAANPTNCSAGNYPLGVDASGNVESCTAAGGGASSSGTGLQYGDGAGGFSEVTSSSVSGANVTLGGTLSGMTQACVDNLCLDGNTVSTTNANGNLVLSPNGTGFVSVKGFTAGLNATANDALFLFSNGVSVFEMRQAILAMIRSNGQYTFSSTAAVGAGAFPDVGLARDAAGRLRVTDASSGTKDLKLARLISAAQAFSIADDGAGTKAVGTLTPTSSYVECSCLDADGCTVTVSETGALTGQRADVVTISAAACEYADTAGVTELAGAFVAGTDDALSLVYGAAQWRELSRSNN